MDYERFTAHLAAALLEFGNSPDDIPPNNAVTLWREIVRGVERVADALTKPPKE